MNERIKKLAEQSGFAQHGFVWVANDVDIERFTELIVRECITVIKDSEGYSQYFPHVTDNIEKNFGVEE